MVEKAPRIDTKNPEAGTYEVPLSGSAKEVVPAVEKKTEDPLGEYFVGDRLSDIEIEKKRKEKAADDKRAQELQEYFVAGDAPPAGQKNSEASSINKEEKEDAYDALKRSIESQPAVDPAAEKIAREAHWRGTLPEYFIEGEKAPVIPPQIRPEDREGWIQHNEAMAEALKIYAEKRSKENEAEAKSMGGKCLETVQNVYAQYKKLPFWKKMAVSGAILSFSVGGTLIGGTAGGILVGMGIAGAGINKGLAAVSGYSLGSTLSRRFGGSTENDPKNKQHIIAGLMGASLALAMPSIMRAGASEAISALGLEHSLNGAWLMDSLRRMNISAFGAETGAPAAAAGGFPVPQGGFDTPEFDTPPEVSNISPGSELGDIPGPPGTPPHITPPEPFVGEYPQPGPGDLGGAPGTPVAPVAGIAFAHEVTVPRGSNSWNAIRGSLPDDLTEKQRENMTGNTLENLKRHPELNPGIKDLGKIKPGTILHLPSDEILERFHGRALSLNAPFPTPPVPPTVTPLASAIEAATGKPPLAPADLGGDTFRPIPAGVEPPEFEPNELGMNPGAQDQAPPVSTTPETPAGSAPTPSTEGLAVAPAIATLPEGAITQDMVDTYAVKQFGGGGIFARWFGNDAVTKMWNSVADLNPEEFDKLVAADDGRSAVLQRIQEDYEKVIADIDPNWRPRYDTVRDIIKFGLRQGVLKPPQP